MSKKSSTHSTGGTPADKACGEDHVSVLRHLRGDCSPDDWAAPALDAAIAALTTPQPQGDASPQARPDGGEAVVWVDSSQLTELLRGPFSEGGALIRAWPVETTDCTKLHPTPAPDVARLVEAARDAVTDMDSCVDWHSSKSDALREALRPFTAAQKERK